MTRGLRREVAGALQSARNLLHPPAEQNPPPWHIIDQDPRLRSLYVLSSMPVRLLDAVEDLQQHADRNAAAEREAERQQPLLAAAVQDLDAALRAADAGESLALPHPAEAIATARKHLHGPQNQIPVPYGRMNRRHVGDGIHYTPSTADGAVEVLLDWWAHLVWNLDRSGSNFWNQESADGLAWAAERSARVDAA